MTPYHPPFDALPEVHGTTDRLVDGRLMDRKAYDLGQWLVVGSYTLDSGKEAFYWAQPYSGIEAVSQDRRARLTAARTRREADNEWSSYIEKQIAREP